jgi:hypothetical protein
VERLALLLEQGVTLMIAERSRPTIVAPGVLNNPY